MKAVHLCLTSIYSDSYSYQENMFVKYQKKFGYDIELITSNLTFNDKGICVFVKDNLHYSDEHGVVVTRLPLRRPVSFYQNVRRVKGLLKALYQANPDILFIHCCQFLDMNIVVKYLKKHSDVKLFVDNLL